jgi:translation initiation factor IF-3
MKVFEKMLQLLTGKFAMEQPPKLEGNHITMVVGPK